MLTCLVVTVLHRAQDWLESSLTRTALLLLARAVPVVSYTSLAFLAVKSPDIFT